MMDYNDNNDANDTPSAGSDRLHEFHNMACGDDDAATPPDVDNAYDCDCENEEFQFVGQEEQYQQYHEHQQQHQHQQQHHKPLGADSNNSNNDRMTATDMACVGVVGVSFCAAAIGLRSKFVHNGNKSNRSRSSTPTASTKTTSSQKQTPSSAAPGVAKSSASSANDKAASSSATSTTEAATRTVHKEQQQTVVTTVLDDDDVPDLVVEQKEQANHNRNRLGSACQHQLGRFVTENAGVQTLVTTSSSPTSEELVRQRDEQIHARTLHTVQKSLEIVEQMPKDSGVPKDKLLEITVNAQLSGQRLHYEECKEARGYLFEHARDERRHERDEKRHKENLEAGREDKEWLSKLKRSHSELKGALEKQALYTLYAFFAVHIVWHLMRLHQAWSWGGMVSALYYSVCGQCTAERVAFESDGQTETDGQASYFSSMSTFVYSIFDSSNYTTTAVMDYVVPTWLVEGMKYQGICAIKIMIGIFGTYFTSMILPSWMIHRMVATIIALTIVSNVLELVPFIVPWTWMAGLYAIAGVACFIYIEILHGKVRKSLTSKKNPSSQDVTVELVRLDRVTTLLEWHMLALLVYVAVCCLWGSYALGKQQQ